MNESYFVIIVSFLTGVIFPYLANIADTLKTCQHLKSIYTQIYIKLNNSNMERVTTINTWSSGLSSSSPECQQLVLRSFINDFPLISLFLFFFTFYINFISLTQIVIEYYDWDCK